MVVAISLLSSVGSVEVEADVEAAPFLARVRRGLAGVFAAGLRIAAEDDDDGEVDCDGAARLRVRVCLVLTLTLAATNTESSSVDVLTTPEAKEEKKIFNKN